MSLPNFRIPKGQTYVALEHVVSPTVENSLVITDGLGGLTILNPGITGQVLAVNSSGGLTFTDPSAPPTGNVITSEISPPPDANINTGIGGSRSRTMEETDIPEFFQNHSSQPQLIPPENIEKDKLLKRETNKGVMVTSINIFKERELAIERKMRSRALAREGNMRTREFLKGKNKSIEVVNNLNYELDTNFNYATRDSNPSTADVFIITATVVAKRTDTAPAIYGIGYKLTSLFKYSPHTASAPQEIVMCTEDRLVFESDIPLDPGPGAEQGMDATLTVDVNGYIVVKVSQGGQPGVWEWAEQTSFLCV
jgi:hypothetical protein